MLATELAREVGEALPDDYRYKLAYIRGEADGLWSLGLGNQALDRFRFAMSHAEQRVAQEPNCADYLRDLSVSYERMGDLERARGHGDAARQFFERSLQLRERLAAQEPNRADYLRDLSVSYERMGDLERARGHGDAARQFFERSLQLREQLLAQEHNRADYQIDVAVSLARLGTSSHLERALGILLKLKQADRLMKADEPKIGTLQEMLRQAKAAGAYRSFPRGALRLESVP